MLTTYRRVEIKLKCEIKFARIVLQIGLVFGYVILELILYKTAERYLPFFE